LKYKKYKRPKLTAQQQAVLRPKCRILLKKYGKKHFILDNESYFTFSNYNMSGNDVFYSNDLSLTPDSVSSKYCIKYEKKVLVYLVMLPKGMCSS
jgi:hypothetical protein